ncbi:PH domain-containing protein [Streptomyces iconiensis]|uniref:PH domain-containing protein n=1 Tax=Streptomyces iconiensis TaxID=1384038 RepID=A0ABT7A661_9ACTN|nr:PH domain-containing protein [Streptomyces iconiensis]MDJ1136815.1 PH domain-containing protein [Streptomyces iconiensis]
MDDVWELTCLPFQKRALWVLVWLGAAGAGVAVARMTYWNAFLDVWVGVGLLFVLLGTMGLSWLSARVRADTYGLHVRTLLRRWSVPWRDVAELRVYLQYTRDEEFRRVSLVHREGNKRLLPLPRDARQADPGFDAKLEALRALHRRYGAPEPGHIPVISRGTAGRGTAMWLVLCVLLLAGAGVAAWSVPSAASYEQAWQKASPCTAGTPATKRRECVTTLPAVIARTEAGQYRKPSWLYFTDSRPLKRLGVSREAAQGLQAGESVEVSVWRREVMEVAGEHHVWREHVPAPGGRAVIAALCVLAAGYPGTRVLMRLRGRRLADDEVLPSALPFAGALVGTALWLLPFCYRHPSALPTSPGAIAWATAGSLATLALFTWAWRATRIHTPGEAGEPRLSGAVERGGAAERAGVGAEMENEGEKEGEVFLAARFLDHTDYNPYGFGTHIVLGDGPPAVTPHPGPGRFAAKRIPGERLALKDVRRARGSDGDTVPRSWHIAELDDAGSTVRLAAAPNDLTRILRELGPAKTSATTVP